MKSENLIHIKLENDEARETKRDVLSSERDLIMLLRTMKRYHLLRSTELAIKLKIQRKIRDLNLNITKLEQVLPKIKIPKILMKETEEEIKEELIPKPTTKGKKQKEDFDKDLERQLREIQEKLSRLQ